MTIIDRLPEEMPDPILLVEVGSTLHGIGIGSDDIDLMGVCIEPESTFFGLNKFEQFEWRTQPKGERSGSGDIDLIVYGLKKYMRLAVQNNPTILTLLFAPENNIHIRNDFGRSLLGIRDSIISQKARGRFVGYLNIQREKALRGVGGGHGAREGRMEKWASHMVRLGYQGHELLSTGQLTLPMNEKQANYCMEIKRGNVSIENAMDVADYITDEIMHLDSPLRKEPDMEAIQKWMKETYQGHFHL